MVDLQSKPLIELNLDTREIIITNNIKYIDIDKNIANIFLQIYREDNTGLKTYLTKEELDSFVGKLFLIKPVNNKPSEITGINTEEFESDNGGGVLRFIIPTEYTNRNGIVKCEIHINKNNELLASDRFVYNVKQSLVTQFNDSLLEDSDFPILQQLILETQKANNINDSAASSVTTYSGNKIEKIKENLSSRIDAFTTLQDGSTTGDAELIDARVGADGIVYNNLGNSIRTQISDVKNQIDSFIDKQFNKNLAYLKDAVLSTDKITFSVIEQQFTITKTGTITQNELQPFALPIDLKAGTYTFSSANENFTSNIGYLHLYKDGTELCVIQPAGVLKSTTFTLDNDATVLLKYTLLSDGFNEAINNNNNIKFNIQIEEGSIATEYVKSQCNLYLDDNVNVNFEIKDKSVDPTKVTFINKQFNKNLAYMEDAVLSTNRISFAMHDQDITITRLTEIPDNEMQRFSVPFNLKAGTYTFSSANENFTANIGYLHLYENDKELCVIQPAGSIRSRTFTLDSNTTVSLKYTLLKEGFDQAITATNNSIKLNVQIEEGPNASDYVKSEQILYLDDNVNLSNMYQKDKLYGKRWNALGDSITAGLGATRPYHNVIASRNYMTITNYGISGTTIAKSEVSDPMCERYVNMDNNADIITVFGGTNDFGKQVPIGTNDSTDTETFKGALNVLIEGLINKYPGKKIFFFTPIQRGDLINLPIKLIEYVDAMIEICGLWGVPCKDMYRGSNLYVRNTFIQNNYFRIGEDGNSDKLHPNNKGHEIIADPIEGFIRNN